MRCLEGFVGWLIFAGAVLNVETARAGEPMPYDLSHTAAYALDAAGQDFATRAVTTRTSDMSLPAKHFDHWKLPVEVKGNAPGQLSKRVSVGRTFDGFGLRWEAGRLELALTDEGMGARLEF